MRGHLQNKLATTESYAVLVENQELKVESSEKERGKLLDKWP